MRNIEKKKLYDKQYRQKNKERIRAYRQEYYRKNKEKIIGKERRYRAENKEKIRIRNREYYKKNKDKIIKKTVAWGKKNRNKTKEYSQRWWCKHIYKTTMEKLTNLRNNQKTCQICGKKKPRGKELCIDHDHETGQVRGLLCDACNWGIGNFKNDPALLARAIIYLKEAENGSKSEHVIKRTVAG